jgi:hypothetical protein
VFFDVYEMAVDTLFLCFLEDIERNDGTAEKPYYMSKDLRQILGYMENSSNRSTPSRDGIHQYFYNFSIFFLSFF